MHISLVDLVDTFFLPSRFSTKTLNYYVVTPTLSLTLKVLAGGGLGRTGNISETEIRQVDLPHTTHQMHRRMAVEKPPTSLLRSFVI